MAGPPSARGDTSLTHRSPRKGTMEMRKLSGTAEGTGRDEPQNRRTQSAKVVQQNPIMPPSMRSVSTSSWGSMSYVGKDHYSLMRRIGYDFVRTVPIMSILWFVLTGIFLTGVKRRLEQFFAEFSLMGLDKLFFSDMLELVVTVVMGVNAAVLGITFLTSGVFQEAFARRFCHQRNMYSTLRAQSLLNILRAAYIATYAAIAAILALGFAAMAMLVIWAGISAVCEEVVDSGPALAENEESISEALANLKDTGITPDMVTAIFRAVQTFCTGREKTYTSVTTVMFLVVLAPLMQINFCMCAFSNIHHLAQEVEKARAEEDGCSRAKQELEKAMLARELEYSSTTMLDGSGVLKPVASSGVETEPNSPSRVV